MFLSDITRDSRSNVTEVSLAFELRLLRDSSAHGVECDGKILLRRDARIVLANFNDSQSNMSFQFNVFTFGELRLYSRAACDQSTDI
jgi:hypothetical protein